LIGNAATTASSCRAVSWR